MLRSFDRCLIIDVHSFPHELNKDEDRPDICIGTDDYHTPEPLIWFVEEHFEGVGLTTKRNVPFGGTFVPMKYYKRDNRVTSIMIEVNRSLYMDEATGDRLASFQRIREVLNSLIGRVTNFA